MALFWLHIIYWNGSQCDFHVTSFLASHKNKVQGHHIKLKAQDLEDTFMTAALLSMLHFWTPLSLIRTSDINRQVIH